MCKYITPEHGVSIAVSKPGLPMTFFSELCFPGKDDILASCVPGKQWDMNVAWSSADWYTVSSWK